MKTRPERDAPKLAAFDMDGTLLAGRVIYTLAQELGFESELTRISRSDVPRYVRSREVAKLLAGLGVSEFAAVVDGMRLTEGTIEVTDWLKNRNCVVGIISDSYTLATGIIAKKLKMDFQVANELVVTDGVITGELRMPMGWEGIGCSCRQSVCKRYHITKEANNRGIDISDTAAVGDAESDLCMIESAGVGVWFNPRRMFPLPERSYSVEGTDLRIVLPYLAGT
jgi:HAD superfamily phosphoserine phosphatase-like hydrolase